MDGGILYNLLYEHIYLWNDDDDDELFFNCIYFMASSITRLPLLQRHNI